MSANTIILGTLGALALLYLPSPARWWVPVGIVVAVFVGNVAEIVIRGLS